MREPVPRYGSSSGFCSAPRRVACWLLCLLFLLPAPISRAQSGKPSELQPSIEHLLKAELLLRELEQALMTRAEQVASLESRLATLGESLSSGRVELEQLKQRLLDSEALRVKLEAVLSETQTWLDELTRKYEQLLASWASYRQEMQAQVGQLQRARNTWRGVAIAGWIAALIAGAFAIVNR